MGRLRRENRPRGDFEKLIRFVQSLVFLSGGVSLGIAAGVAKHFGQGPVMVLQEESKLARLWGAFKSDALMGHRLLERLDGFLQPAAIAEPQPQLVQGHAEIAVAVKVSGKVLDKFLLDFASLLKGPERLDTMLGGAMNRSDVVMAFAQLSSKSQH